MLQIDFVTLFPEVVLSATRFSICGRAAAHGIASFGAVNPRDFARDTHRTVDDRPFDGGPGMVLMAQPILDAVASLDPGPESAIVFADARGALFRQADAAALAQKPRVVFVCGHYSGVDQRAIDALATHVYSVGDFVVTGGELPSLLMADAVVRLLPGALGSEESASLDSHQVGLLGPPVYTQPAEAPFGNVPEPLRSGNHEAARAWKRAASLRATRRNRPDLFWRAILEKGDADMLSS